MKFKSLKVGLATLSLSIGCLFNVANAGVITDTTDNSFIDQTTNLEWMDFGINNGQSYNYVASQLGSGGEYEGWSLPTSGQVYAMWANAFLGLGSEVVDPNYYGTGQGRVDDRNAPLVSVLDPVMDAMGTNYRAASGDFSTGVFLGENGYSAFRVYNDRRSQWIDFSWLMDNGRLNIGGDTANTITSSTLLVRAQVAAVPEPPLVAIFALGLMGLVLRRFKKQA
ncbi:PEP-CTERM sorting domain-containing protein [Psychromonas ingrahamii]|nr:PEP-CTERM sorting domain-containing protein [Psychromonas ingrahamii]